MSEAVVPPLSVVVVVFAGAERLARCLAALERQEGAPQIEILVPYDSSLAEVAALEPRFSGVRFAAFDGPCPPAELRARGVARTRAGIIALLEDHCVPDVDWAARIIAAHTRNVGAVGGVIEKGAPPGGRRDTALNWALYIADYSRYMGPLPEGPAATVSDCNSSYKRSALEEVRETWSTEFHENVVNAALQSRGRALWFDPSIVVREQRSLGWRAALTDRFTFGRLFGATRAETIPFPRRLALVLSSPVLPPLLAVRAARNLIARRRHLSALAKVLPALGIISMAWVLGEATGYLTGRPGASLAASRKPGERNVALETH
jgi:hypothetical protein